MTKNSETGKQIQKTRHRLTIYKVDIKDATTREL